MPGDIRVFIIAPESEKNSLPSEEEVRQLIKQSPRMKISPPLNRTVGDELLPNTPSSGLIVSESLDSDTGAIRWELGNGAKVILKETKNRNNEIVLRAMARGGSTSVPPEDDVSAGLAAEMISVSGMGPYSRTELSRKLADKQVSISYWISNYYRGLDGSTTMGDIKTLFEMIYLGFTDPRIDPEAVKVMMDQYRTALAQRNENPDTVFSDEINKVTYGNHPHFKPLELADLPKANMDTALNFIRRGLNPGDYTFIFTGNLDTEMIRYYVESYIASIPRKETWDTWTKLNIERPAKTEKTVYKGKEERSLVYMGWFNKIPYSEENSAAAQVLSEYLDIRMTEEIREKLGGVYSISVGVSVSPVPESELIMVVYFACDPRRARELSNAVLELLNRTVNSAINQDTFGKSVEALKKEWESSIQSNSYIAQSYSNSSVLLNLPLSRLDKRPRYYEGVTPADIQKICAQASQNGPALVILYPEQNP
jgi:zinc protease